jgi:hypothetical protein
MRYIRNFLDYCKSEFEGLSFPRTSPETTKHLEDTFLPHIFRIMKKDNSIFTECEIFPGTKIPTLNDDGWKKFQYAMLEVVFSGNPTEKLSELMGSFKENLPGGKTTDEINEILEDKETKDALNEMLELVMKTKFAGIVIEVLVEMDYDELGLDFENPEYILKLIKNPTENPSVNKFMENSQKLLKQKLESGKINQADIRQELETIRAKFQSTFGKYLNEMMGTDGNTTGNTGQQILSNSPEARRARMLARLQKKLHKKV